MIFKSKTNLAQRTKPHVFIKHIVLYEGETLPPVSSDCFYEYIWAANGVFVRSERDGLYAIIPVAQCIGENKINGLGLALPEVRLAQRVSLDLTSQMLSVCQEAMPDECMMWLGYSNGSYQLTVPEQSAEKMRVRPALPFQKEGVEALVDLHSHNAMMPVFSGTDDQDETGFRIFAVVGWLDSRPSIMVRVGVFGHFAILNAHKVFELPDWIEDMAAQERTGRRDGLLCIE